MSVSSVIQIRLDIKPITPASNIPPMAPWPWWPITGKMWGLQTNENTGVNHPSSVIQLRIIQSILMKELKFVLVGVNLNFAGMLLWLMASAPGKGEIHYLKECFHKALKVKLKITYEWNELVLCM